MTSPLVRAPRSCPWSFRQLRAVLVASPVLWLLACAGGDTGDTSEGAAASNALPAEAFGTFEDRNDPTFSRVLLVEATRLVVTTTVMVNGRAAGNPLQCRSQDGVAIAPVISLSLDCDGEQIPYTLTFRADKSDWVVVEDASAPMIFGRLSTVSVAASAAGESDTLPPAWANDDALPIWAGYFREGSSYLVDNEQDPIALCTDLVSSSPGAAAGAGDSSSSSTAPPPDGNCMVPIAESPVVLTVAPDGAYRVAWAFDEPSHRRGLCTGTLAATPVSRNPDSPVYYGDRYPSEATCTLYDAGGSPDGPNAVRRVERAVMHFEHDASRSRQSAEWSLELPDAKLSISDLYRMPLTDRQRQIEAEARTHYFARKEASPPSSYLAKRRSRLREPGTVSARAVAPPSAPATDAPVSDLVKTQCALEVDENAYAFFDGHAVDLAAWRRTTTDRVNMAYIRCIRSRR